MESLQPDRRSSWWVLRRTMAAVATGTVAAAGLLQENSQNDARWARRSCTLQDVIKDDGDDKPRDTASDTEFHVPKLTAKPKRIVRRDDSWIRGSNKFNNLEVTRNAEEVVLNDEGWNEIISVSESVLTQGQKKRQKKRRQAEKKDKEEQKAVRITEKWLRKSTRRPNLMSRVRAMS